ncbi:MAG: hypothetical protein D6762_08235, partial [Candidatus Neomarinimicrobiota bacterium]
MEHENESMQTYPPVRSVTVRVITDKPVKKTPYQVKGVLMRLFPEEEIVPMLDGRYRDRFLYPRVQVKILNEQIYMVGIGEGVDAILAIAKQMEILDFGNITFQVLDVDIEEHDDRLRPTNRLIRYRFITPWVALNQMTGSRYRFLNNPERVSFLNRLLGQNIVFIAREMGMELTEKVYTKVSLSSLFPKPVDENAWGAFFGEFRTNFILPNYLGVGNGITRGYGAIYGLFNPEMFTFDESDLKEGAQEETAEELPPKVDEAPEGLEAIDADEVPKPRREVHPQGPRRPRRNVRRRGGFRRSRAPFGPPAEGRSRFNKE